MSDTDADPLRRIAATIDREREPSSRVCLSCGGPALVVVTEEPAGNSPPVISVRKECAHRRCEHP
ncbi:hypothetical protein BLA24_06825 [Streptomyces cinnamoneus]|uniref:Uncharacterized protein n=1 Tax=Streptomyces cinnamoneus TaxID=53446 RepID=A0A2G1XML4_STRCJ|nr:hypothetical protein [Streptomyces cinnamoneus]PHQ52487.1 hypothetical protein BLA24_06825 [Streptomyces cinnamoneus]PPT16020.1 hypothetical protein CYQ11_26975 [Streptomyces cinnamoneus]